MDQEQAIVISGPAGMEHYAIAQCIARLKIEANTGMVFRQSTLKIVQQRYGIKARTKAKALDEMLEFYKQKYGRPYGNG
jgi:cytidylate kinase